MMVASALPSLYEYYTSGGITSGLSTDQSYFTLNDRNITIYSGSVHYFRVPRPYWRDRLRKVRAAGLNTVDTYIPWNLHEPHSGEYDFGNGGSDFEDFLHLKEFLKIVKEEDLFAIVRPGPYICAEWDFGGLPSWLLKDKNIQVRSSQRTYMDYVARYFRVLLSILAMFQFTKGGPIIAFQVENEFGSTDSNDKAYIHQLETLMRENGLVELLLASDGVDAIAEIGTSWGDIFQTANFGGNPEYAFGVLKRIQPGKPIMAMEFWMGWFNHWGENRVKVPCRITCKIYERILKLNASVNIYMFHGGTSFGFMNGANIDGKNGYQPDITSYDYDAPLTERGDYTEKYREIKRLIEKYNPIKTRLPQMPRVKTAFAFPPVGIRHQLSMYDIINNIQMKSYSVTTLPMEEYGQSYGYIVYRKHLVKIFANSVLKISGHVRDTVMVLLNGKLISKPLEHVKDFDGFGYWKLENSNITLTDKDVMNATIDLIVENWGRVNFGRLRYFKQYKGLNGEVYLGNVPLTTWQVFTLDFKKSWTKNLKNWKPFKQSTLGPTLYNVVFDIRKPQDTFVNMALWTKGIVIVNGFVLGRYAKIGPQEALYLPGCFLRRGKNSIIVFEHFTPSNKIVFARKPHYDSSVQVSFNAMQTSEQGRHLYWTVGILVFIINNIAMVGMYVLFKKRGRL